jgi:hypothetical protein
MLAAEFAQSRDELWGLLRDYLAAYAARRPIRKVTVIGNAPLLPDPGRVAEIDSSDLVIRMNELVLDEPGEPPCVGTACHAVILSHATTNTRWVFRNYRNRAYLVPQAGFPRYFQVVGAVRFSPADLGAVPLPNAIIKKRLVNLLDPDHEPGRLIPTSGLMGLYLAHELFPEADLIATGFSFLDGAPQQSWQHHAGSRTEVHQFHDLAREAALLRSWIDDGSMRFLR